MRKIFSFFTALVLGGVGLITTVVSSHDVGASAAGPLGGSPSISYQTHVQDIGWQGEVGDGQLAGTTGQSLRLEGIKINLDLDGYTGGIEYQTHIQNIGWQSKVKDGEMSGTEGQSLRLEAIRINLYGQIANDYSVCYRVHAQEFGWLDWTCDGNSAGTATYGYRLEGIEIKMIEKTNPGDMRVGDAYRTRLLKYRTHVQDVGWQDYVWDGEMSGTSGRSLRLEGINISLGDIDPLSGGITYRTHVQNMGWQDWKSDGEMAGTSGQSLRLEGIEIKLTGQLAEYYDVYYRTHVQDIGWQDWVINGAMAGTSGRSLRLEGIEIKIAPKGGGMGAISDEEDPGEQAQSFSISYNLQGGAVTGNPDFYTDKSEDIVLNNPHRTNYEFLGWTGSNGDKPSKEVTISSGTTGPLSYTANWQRKEIADLANYKPVTPVVEMINDNSEYDVSVKIKNEDETLYVNGFEITASYEGEEREAMSRYSTWTRALSGSSWEDMMINEQVSGLELKTGDEKYGKQEIRARAYENINGERYYSDYSEPITVEYNRLNLNLEGGEMPSSNSVSAEEGVIRVDNERNYYVYGKQYKLLNPNKYGYKFLGWTGSNGETPEKNVYISADDRGELEYTAQWEPVPEEYYITLNTPNLQRGDLAGDEMVDSWADYILKAYYDDAEYYVDGFELYQASSKDGEYVLAGMATYGESDHSYYDENGQRHFSDIKIDRSLRTSTVEREMYYKVRAFRMENGEKKYSRLSDAVEIKTGILKIDLDGGTLPDYTSADGVPNIDDGVGYVYLSEEDGYVEGRMYVYDQEYRLMEPERTGWTFVGWTGSNGDTPKKNIKIEAGTTGTLEYKANWVEGEPSPSVEKPTLELEDSETLAVKAFVGYSDYGDYAEGFELGYSYSMGGEYTKYSSWCMDRPVMGASRYNSVIKECNLFPNEIDRNIYLAARGYKTVDGERIYGEWSEPVLIKVQSVEFDLDGGDLDGMGMGYGTIEEEPFTSLEPTAKGYIIGKRYKVAQPMKDGYIFKGWTGSNGEIPEYNLYIEKSENQPLHYKANWERIG